MSSSGQPFTIADLLDFLERLSTAHIHHMLATARADAVMVKISVPGERWEVEFMRGGWLEIEVFRSVGGVQYDNVLDRLFEEYSD